MSDATELFCAGTRAFLEGSWQRRDLAMPFFAGDGPPGFEVMKRRRSGEWIGQNDALLRLPDTALDRLYAAILTNLIGEGAREVAMAKTRRQANQIIDAVIEYARRLMDAGVWKPAGQGRRGRRSAVPGRPPGLRPGGPPPAERPPSAPRARTDVRSGSKISRPWAERARLPASRSVRAAPGDRGRWDLTADRPRVLIRSRIKF